MKSFRWPAIATGLSILACYGTLIAVAALGALGITLSIDTGLWATGIVGFALLAVIGLFVAHRRHGSLAPSLVALVGCAALVVTSFVTYMPLVEALGFGLLCVAVWMDRKNVHAL